MAGSLLLGATGCGGGGDEGGVSDDYKVVAGTQLCGGKAISADASKALKVITGSSHFEASAEEYTIAQAATDLVEALPPTVTEDACLVYTPRDTPDFELKITWRLDDSAPTGPSAPEFTELRMGELALTAVDQALVYFACRGDRLSTPTTVAHVVIGVEHRDPFHEPEGDVAALKDAYATVAHSVSLAMAKELRCENNGGLPAKPVLDPA